MKTKTLVIVSTLAFFMFASFSTVSAQTTAPKVAKTQVKQQKRIRHGVKTGDLTKAETIQLKKQQRRINRSKKIAKADGKVTRAERARIRAQQKAASANIARKKHNKRDRN